MFQIDYQLSLLALAINVPSSEILWFPVDVYLELALRLER